MKKNVAGQFISAEMITRADGTDFTGTVSVAVTKDNGTQTAGTGTVTHKGSGHHSYAPVQAETNADRVVFTFTGTGAITASPQVFTSFPQTADALQPTTAGRTLDVNATGEAGLDLNNTTGTWAAAQFASNFLTAAKIATAALNGKGDWNIGKTGYALSTAGILAIWNQLTSALTTASTIGKLLVDNIDAAISSRNSVTPNTVAPDNAGIAANGVAIAAVPTAVENRVEMDVNSIDLNAILDNQTTINTNVLANATLIGLLNDLSFDDIWVDNTIPESYAANGAAFTPAQGMHMMWSDLRSPAQVGTVWSDFKLNNTTVSMTFSLDDATTPTKKTRTA